MAHEVKDINLSEQGKKRIEWAEFHMPVMNQIKERFLKEKPFEGTIIGACLHVTKETAVLLKTLQAGGATVAACGSNPLSTEDDIAAALAQEGINIFAWRGVNRDEYFQCVHKVLDFQPKITMDDGADLVSTLHSHRQELIPNVIAGTEETTTGVVRFKAMEKDKALNFPVIAVNDSQTKYLFDNRYGTGQSTMDGILRATSVLIAGKKFVVVGYGWCGRGMAMRAKGMGANVVVTEVDPTKALEAVMDGFTVMPMNEAAKIGDIFVTLTGDKHVITKEHVENMKNGAILANSGHFDVEIDSKGIEEITEHKEEVKPNNVKHVLKNGKIIYLLAEGRLVNLASAEGHPSEVMDMSFANQALTAEWLLGEGKNLDKKVYVVPEHIDHHIAELKLAALGVKIDKLTEEQKKYLTSWQEGT